MRLQVAKDDLLTEQATAADGGAGLSTCSQEWPQCMENMHDHCTMSVSKRIQFIGNAQGCIDSQPAPAVPNLKHHGSGVSER